jgi:hypothetical protein
MWTVVDGPVSECTYPKSLEMVLKAASTMDLLAYVMGKTEGTNFCSEVIRPPLVRLDKMKINIGFDGRVCSITALSAMIGEPSSPCE